MGRPPARIHTRQGQGTERQELRRCCACGRVVQRQCPCGFAEILGAWGLTDNYDCQRDCWEYPATDPSATAIDKHVVLRCHHV